MGYTGLVKRNHPRAVAVNICTHDYDVYVGRGSKWGNPFTHRSDVKAKRPGLILVDTAREAIERYEAWLDEQEDLQEDLVELEGQRLGCYCKPGPCHADVLARRANE